MAKSNSTIEDRFWSKVQKTDGCWNWTGGLSPSGYGVFYLHSLKAIRAHVQSYVWAKGPIPPGLELDHLCRNRRCVNPDHLEAVTHRVNTLRGDTIPARYAARTHCLNGHPLIPDNLVTSSRCRICLTCRQIYNLNRRKVSS